MNDLRMTPVDTLRAAAKRLREAANAATPGPYGVETVPETKESRIGSPITQRWVVEGRTRYPDAIYIALMHPGVALAVADWLDFEANAVEASTQYPSRRDPSPSGYSLAVALTVLGGDA
jgi:hypothetical protein